MQKFLFGTLAGLFIPTAVFAQTATIPEGVGVADRARPDYKPIGGRIGSFFLYPVIDVSAEASDNVKASSTDRKSDAYAVISGNAKLQSNFSRHALNLQVHADQSLHARASSEDVTRYGVKLDGLYDISRDASLSALVLADHTFEERTSYNIPLDAIEPGVTVCGRGCG
ncbi:MAG: outer membrane beta-barrel protein [Novosphingobium sp.]